MMFAKMGALWLVFMLTTAPVGDLVGAATLSGYRSGSDVSDLLAPRARPSHCKPFSVVFDLSTNYADFQRNFAPLDGSHSYELNSGGLSLFLDKPEGKIVTKDKVNSKVAEGSTFNSTFTVLYGKVTYTFMGPAVPGVVTAAILIALELDEIDIELVGGSPTEWQTNTFAPAPGEHKPLYSTFSSLQNYPHGHKTVAYPHAYSIDWSPERIIWSIDGSEVRTLRADETMKNGNLHFPSHPARLQFGIWDASAPAGTSEWAHGPIDWTQSPERMSAIFQSIQVECPY